jgi:hypothetical protein
MTTEKKPRGRPTGTTKEKTGVNMWIPADLLDTVKLMIQANRQAQQQKQVTQ